MAFAAISYKTLLLEGRDGLTVNSISCSCRGLEPDPGTHVRQRTTCDSGSRGPPLLPFEGALHAYMQTHTHTQRTLVMCSHTQSLILT